MRLLSSLYTERIFSNGYDFPRIREPKRLDRTCVYRGYFAVRVDHQIESLLYFVDACSGLFFFPSLVPNSPPSPSEENTATWPIRFESFATRINAKLREAIAVLLTGEKRRLACIINVMGWNYDRWKWRIVCWFARESWDTRVWTELDPLGSWDLFTGW